MSRSASAVLSFKVGAVSATVRTHGGEPFLIFSPS
jgi:hypothetical protein